MDLLDVFKDSEDLVTFSAGEVILREGEPGDHMYVVMEGDLSILISGTVIATASPGDIVGEMALINSETRTATVIADTNCLLLELPHRSTPWLARHDPDFAFKLHVALLRTLCWRLREQDIARDRTAAILGGDLEAWLQG